MTLDLTFDLPDTFAPRKCADIPDVLMVAATIAASGRGPFHDPAYPSAPWPEVAAVLTGGEWDPDRLPFNLLRAKARKVIDRRQLLDGCSCGCATHWTPTAAGWRLLLAHATPKETP